MNNTKISSITFVFIFCISYFANAATPNIDNIQFGNTQSEQKHRFQSDHSEAKIGGLNEPNRILLPKDSATFEGGTVAFRMKVDPEKQNYFTVRFWGGDVDKCMMLLFCEGKQVGYRHLGDIDFLWEGNGKAPLPGRYFYNTLPIPFSLTKGKNEINLQIRAYGEVWGYGDTFEKYQHKLEKPTRGIFNAYTHTATCFVPDKKEIQGKPIDNDLVKVDNDTTVLNTVKQLVNAELIKCLYKQNALNQLEMWFVADAYSINWTAAYNNLKALDRVQKSIDEYYKAWQNNPELLIKDARVYNSEWLAVGPIARAIRGMWPDLKIYVDSTRRNNWSKMLWAGLQFGITHRRQYTNQSMIVDLFAYHTNYALQLITPEKAEPESKMLNYLYESIGLKPWLGIETENGPQKPLGDNYWQLTTKGLTKELGFVGYYGEVLDWVNDIYKATCVDGKPNSGDEQIRKQLLKIMKSRAYFRYPALDNDGFRAMRAEAVVGWRDADHYPGDIIYGDRGTAWDATPLQTAANTFDPEAIGYAQQMLEDNQFLDRIREKLKFGTGIRNLKSLLFVPDEYEWLQKQAPVSTRLPMSPSSSDFVFADEEDGVVAVKNGDEILYASLYWRARYAVNNLAKVHYITPTMDKIANVCIETKLEPSGLNYTRQDWVNMGFGANRNWYKGIHSAHVGEVMPVAKIPQGIAYQPGQENPYAGRASFYLMRYGNYLIAMNSSADKYYEVNLPDNAIDLTNGKKLVNKGTYKLQPMTTVVYYLGK